MNNRFYACISPNWGEPTPVPTTIRDTPEEAERAAIWDQNLSLYSGAVLHVVPPRPGTMENLRQYKFRIAEIEVRIVE